ncbi:MAG TPA: BTAD domain-containing putative transcriptional regulator [Acidimicrobiales bacterium]|nr:BTAD domain-containing putative transcriptional regulator [Acidimicrobiales bacterium]
MDAIRTRIQICGEVIVELDGERVESSLPGRQGRWLFAYLVIHASRSVPRPELIEAVWPTGPPEAADTSLSALLSRLRRVLGGRVDRGSSVRLDLSDASVDLDEAEEAIHRAESAVVQHRWERAWASSQVALFTARRGFLPGDDAPWIAEVRVRLEQLHLRSLECYGEAGLGLGGTELAAAREAGRVLVEREPLRESGHRLLMRALAAEGNPAEALRAYDHLCAVLRDELGVSPSTATRALYDELVR